MIKSSTYILTDDQGREMLENDMQLFDVTANDGNIHQFAAGHIPSHWHRELEIFVLLEGRIQICIGNGTYRLQEGDGCFINTEVIHSFTAQIPSSCHFRSFVFSPEIVGGTPGSIFDTAYVRPLMEHGVSFLKFQKNSGDSVYFQAFDRAFAACAEEGDGYEFRVRDALSDIILYVKSKSITAQDRTIPSGQEMRLKQMLMYIDRNLENHITVPEIAGAANICTRECQRIFHRYIHYSPTEYILRKRMFHAARMLADTDSSVTDIALNCGFSNPCYFSKQFRQMMNTTPRAYRAEVREKIQNSSER